MIEGLLMSSLVQVLPDSIINGVPVRNIFIEEPGDIIPEKFITFYYENIDCLCVGCETSSVIDVIIHIWTKDNSYAQIASDIDDIFTVGSDLGKYCNSCAIIRAVNCRVWEARVGKVCDARWTLYQKTFRIVI